MWDWVWVLGVSFGIFLSFWVGREAIFSQELYCLSEIWRWYSRVKYKRQWYLDWVKRGIFWNFFEKNSHKDHVNFFQVFFHDNSQFWIIDFNAYSCHHLQINLIYSLWFLISTYSTCRKRAAKYCSWIITSIR